MYREACSKSASLLTKSPGPRPARQLKDPRQEVVEPDEYTSNGCDHPDDDQERNDKEKHRCEHVNR
jgi:hypothetical protein